MSRSFEPLHAAFRAGDLSALRAALGEAPDFPNTYVHPAIGWCLTYAIYWSPVAFIEQLLNLGANPNLDPGDGFPPLLAALSTGRHAAGAHVRDDRHAVIALLLARGASPDQRGINDYTPLHEAAAQGDLRAVDLLLAHGAGPDAVTRVDDPVTPWEIAAALGHRLVADRLRGITLGPHWIRASREGDVDTLIGMLDAGYDVNARDGYGQTALMRAAHAGRLDAVTRLVQRGADLNHASKFGLSAVMLAVLGGHAAVARTLAAAGADLSRRGTGAPGFAGKSAADLARDRGDRALAEALTPKPDR
jgi:ankyrin repeat protein